jgi:hypothetical protein
LDERGIPGCFVVTTEFREAAALQSRALGFDAGIVWAPHPIQNRTSEELGQIAADLVDEILAMIVSSAAVSVVNVVINAGRRRSR